MLDLGINYEENNGGPFLSKVLHYPLKQWRHCRRLTKALRAIRADIVISMFCNDAGFLPGIKDGSRKVLEIHFSRFKRLQYGRKGLWALADRWRNRHDAVIAKRYDRFVVLTEEDKEFWGPLHNIRVIPNPRTFTFDAPATLDNHQVLAVGRYSYQKGFDILLDAWRKMDTTGWNLRIAGSGDDLGPLPGNVILGPSTDIKEEYQKSAFLVMSSRYEGLPMVLLEAQAAGLPAVAFTCKCGPRDVITDGENGFLVPEGDVDGLATGMRRLMDDPGLRRSMGAAAYSNSDKYDKERIMSLWENLFQELS
jgi:Glycosyltransferase